MPNVSSLLVALAVAVALAGCAAPASPLGDAEAAHAGTTCGEAGFVSGFGPDGAPTCTPSPLAGFACPIGEVVVGFDLAGAPVCEPVMAVAEAAMQAERGADVSPSAPATTLSITSSGPLANGVKAYTIASASPGLGWGELGINLNGQMLSRAPDGCTPGPGEFAACAGGTPEAGDAQVDAGDVLRVAAESGQTLRFLDLASNSVVLTLTVG